MSTDLQSIRARIRDLTRDTNATQPAVDDFVYDTAIGSNLQQVAGELGTPVSWVDWVPLVASTIEYTVTAAELLVAGIFRLKTAGYLVDRVSPEAFERLRDGVSQSPGIPYVVALFESAGATAVENDTLLRIYPPPKTADTLQVLKSEVPDLPAAEADVLGISKLAARALELSVAAEILIGLTDEDQAKLRVNGMALAQRYLQRYEDLKYSEEVRIAQLRRSGQQNMSTRRGR